MSRRWFGAVGLALVSSCGDSRPGGPAGPEPWTSGERIRAQQYTGPELVAFAGRFDTQLGFGCTVDEHDAPWFFDCPHEVWMLYSATDCSVRDVAIDPKRAPLYQYAAAFVDGALHYYDVSAPFTDYWAYDRDASGTCTVPAAGPNERTAAELPPDFLQLGTVAAHESDGVGYSALETPDGFSVITDVDGGVETTEPTNARIRARWLSKGEVRSYRGLYDDELQTNCVAAVAGNSIVCVPDAHLGPIYPGYATSACTDPPTILFAMSSGYSTDFTDYQPDGRHFSRVVDCSGDPGPVFQYLRGLSGCTEVPNAVRCKVVPLTTFATLTKSTQ